MSSRHSELKTSVRNILRAAQKQAHLRLPDDALNPSSIDPHLLAHVGVPDAADAIAYEPVQRLLAVRPPPALFQAQPFRLLFCWLALGRAAAALAQCGWAMCVGPALRCLAAWQRRCWWAVPAR